MRTRIEILAPSKSTGFMKMKTSEKKKKARELLRNNFMGQGESFLCNFRSALLCLRGSRTPRRRNLDVKDRDLEIEKGQAGLR